MLARESVAKYVAMPLWRGLLYLPLQVIIKSLRVGALHPFERSRLESITGMLSQLRGPLLTWKNRRERKQLLVSILRDVISFSRQYLTRLSPLPINEIKVDIKWTRSQCYFNNGTTRRRRLSKSIPLSFPDQSLIYKRTCFGHDSSPPLVHSLLTFSRNQNVITVGFQSYFARTRYT